jgi:beta-glucosidase
MLRTIPKLCSALLIFTIIPCFSQNEGLTPYKNSKLTVEVRVKDLVSQMTLEEKVSQMMNHSLAIPRLDIPEYDWWNEALHGVARADLATVFPQAIGLAATWDPELIQEMAGVISLEARAKYIKAQADQEYGRYKGLTMWSPNINIFRDPRWGRGHETYGEDPFLTAEMGKAFVRGLQGEDETYLMAVSTPKHFAVHSGPEPLRHEFDAVTSERDLYDTYLPAFKATIIEAGAYSVMCAYNSYLGVPCCGSELLLTDILREEWGFEGYVVSDCNAIRDISENHKYVSTGAEGAALAVKSGCDLNCGSYYKYLVEAVEKGFITEDEIDVAVRRLFTARFKLGFFDDNPDHPYNRVPYSVVDAPEHRVKSLEVARSSMVLLKNSDHTLPLSKEIRTLAVIGPNADSYGVLIGNYHGTPSMYYTALDGIKRAVSDETLVYYEPGCNLLEVDKPALRKIESQYLSFEGKNGLLAEYFDNKDLQGIPFFRRIDDDVDYNWIKNRIPGLDDEQFSVRWTGKIKPPLTGEYTIGLEADDGFRLFINDREVINNWENRKDREKSAQITLNVGEQYDVRIEYFQSTYLSACKMSWALPGKTSRERALELAAKSDAVVFVGGISPDMEGETGDKSNIDFPEVQRSLLRAISAVNSRTILVLNNGSALAVNWEKENIPAILEAWYPGEEGGTAIADVLFGDYNPSGRLPVTFYKSEQDLPPFDNYFMEGRTYRYFNKEPLFPFGFGLSYTTFDYTDLKIDDESIRRGDCTTVSFILKNSGSRAGNELAQLYVKDMKSSELRPLKDLKGIRKIHLQPGEEQEVNFTIDQSMLGFTDIRTKEWIVEPGLFEIQVGGSSDLFISTLLRVKK